MAFEIKSTLTNRSGQVLDIIYYEGLNPNENLEGKIMQAVHGFCFYKDKLVVVYAESKGYWTLPGGGIEPGETYEEATIREIKEESNMKVLRQELIGYQDIYEPDRTVRQTRSFCIVEPYGDFVTDPDGDITEIKLIDPKDLKKYIDWKEIGDRILERALELKKIMTLPKVKFELIDIDRETELFYSFTDRSRFSFVFDKFFPKLVAIRKECKDRNKCMKKFREFLEDLSNKTKERMLAFKEKLESEWDKIGQEFLEALSEHFETEWSGDKFKIIGYITNLPVFPRFLDEYKFCVGYENLPKSIETSAHEIVHFLWFKKWKETFPKIDRGEYESPRLAWRLSEIMDPIILQCHPKIKELVKPKGWGYSSFKDIKIGDVGMTEYFKKVYLDSVNVGDDFATTLKKLWKEAQKHEKEISKF